MTFRIELRNSGIEYKVISMEQNKITKLEDIIAWQRARELLKMVYDSTKNLPKSEEYNLKKHQRECVRNIPGNIGEGFGRFNYQECLQFYRIARGSLHELKSDVYCCFDLGYYDAKSFEDLIDKIEEVNRLLNGLIKSSVLIKFKK
ncbi:MAG: four helix bundle protein [bacterium]|nr:four helix bundle protein [bacterium]